MKRRFLSVLAWLALAACTPGQMKHDFSAYYACPEDKGEVIETDVTSSGSDKYQVSGCGRQAEFRCRGAGCASPQITIAKRHAREFECGFSQISVGYLDGGAWKASGCGHDTTYQCADSDEFIVRCFAETTDRDRKQLTAGAGD
jgi:hypothetical protein